MKTIYKVFLFCLVIINSCYIIADEYTMPAEFVNLQHVDPSIILNLKYCQKNNILDKPLNGCSANKAFITETAATALRNAQEDLLMHGYSLVLYNAYYPYKTYEELSYQLLKYHGTDPKHYIIDTRLADEVISHYIQSKLSHSRGSTVDVTIISVDNKLLAAPQIMKRSYKNSQEIIYVSDGTIDMGTSYDFFDPLSRPDNILVSQTAQDNRKLLKTVMQNYGFIADENFWWQFTLVREKYPDSNFNFDI